MQIRFLTVDSQEVFLLGYPLRLSKTEHKLLDIIARGGRCGVDDLAELLPQGVSKGNVAVHINAINKKARAISGRKLIIYEDQSYKINPFM